MARPPEVFVRPVTMAEGRRLQRIGRTAKDPVRLRRAIVVLMSAQGQSVPDIAHLLDCSPEYVRTVIHAFNKSGFAALDPKWSGGRPKTISEQARREICLLARCCPRDLGLAFSTWSLTKLTEYLAATGVAVVSGESIRQILRAGGVRWLATKTWKASTDPDFIAKMRRVLELYDHPPADGRVICADEFGPLNLQPRPGRAWRPGAHPARLRATYTRTRGVRHMLAALDLATGKISYRIDERKRWREFLAFLKLLRARWPGQKLYLVLDNFSPQPDRHMPAGLRLYLPSDAPVDRLPQPGRPAHIQLHNHGLRLGLGGSGAAARPAVVAPERGLVRSRPGRFGGKRVITSSLVRPGKVIPFAPTGLPVPAMSTRLGHAWGDMISYRRRL